MFNHKRRLNFLQSAAPHIRRDHFSSQLRGNRSAILQQVVDARTTWRFALTWVARMIHAARTTWKFQATWRSLTTGPKEMATIDRKRYRSGSRVKKRRSISTTISESSPSYASAPKDTPCS